MVLVLETVVPAVVVEPEMVLLLMLVLELVVLGETMVLTVFLLLEMEVLLVHRLVVTVEQTLEAVVVLLDDMTPMLEMVVLE